MNTKMNKASTNRLSALIEELARANDNQHKKELVEQARRALQPIPKSEEVTRRLNALLEAYRALPPRLQDRPTGRRTVDKLRAATINRLSLPNTDDTLSEDTIRKDLQHLGPLLRLVRLGVISSELRPVCKRTEQEMDWIRRQQARLGGRNYSEPPADNIDPDLNLPQQVRQVVARAHKLHAQSHGHSPARNIFFRKIT
jgi:hypothetical protein